LQLDEAYDYIADLEYEKEELENIASNWHSHAEQLERMGGGGPP
jgi:hypothetical protein